MKSYVLFTALALILSAPAYAEGRYANHSNGDRGHHRCGGNSGQGIGNECVKKTQKAEKPYKKFCKRKDGGGDNRTGLDNGKGNGGYNNGKGNEGRGRNGADNGVKSKIADKVKQLDRQKIKRLELSARSRLQSHYERNREYYKRAARDLPSGEQK